MDSTIGSACACREYHFIKSLGPEVALLGIDMRTKRCKEAILPQVLLPLFQPALWVGPCSAGTMP
jgi:hypothetical protein